MGGIPFVHSGSPTTVDPGIPLLCRDGARRCFANQADIACTKREAMRCSASRKKGELHAISPRNRKSFTALASIPLVSEIGHHIRFSTGCTRRDKPF